MRGGIRSIIQNRANRIVSYFSKYIKSAVGLLKRNKVIFENFSYLTLFQVLSLIFPLITYPYLVRVLGKELYGLVITAQVLSGYCTIIVQFGFPLISAKHIAINKDNKEELSRIMSAILCSQAFLLLVSFALYMAVICLVPSYREHFLLFFYSFFLVLQSILFPQFYFQGIEKMKYVTIIQLVFQLIFVALTFVVIKEQSDYVYVPLLHSIGYAIGGVIALYLIFVKDGIKFRKPIFSDVKYYTKDALPIFSTDVICTIKDKLNYLLLGSMVSMSQVVVYDVGAKIHALMMKPNGIILTVIFPKMAKDKDDRQFKKVAWVVFGMIVFLYGIINLFLHPIVFYFIGEEIDLLPIRLFVLCPLFLGVSQYFARCFFIARGYNKHILYSIVITTFVYIVSLIIFYLMEQLNSVTTFVILTLLSFVAELLYRIIVYRKLMRLSNAD